MPSIPAPLAAHDALAPHDSAVVLRQEWSKSTVSLEALDRALYALADRATGTVSDGGAAWQTELHPRLHTADLAALAHALRQEVNDQSLRVAIAARTDSVRNLIFALAFSRAALSTDGPER